MDKNCLMNILQVAIKSSQLNSEDKDKAEKEYLKLKEEKQNYNSLKERSLLFIKEYNDTVKNDIAELIANDNNFSITIIFTNYDLDSNRIKENLTDKYFKDLKNNISFRYKPNTYYSSLY